MVKQNQSVYIPKFYISMALLSLAIKKDENGTITIPDEFVIWLSEQRHFNPHVFLSGCMAAKKMGISFAGIQKRVRQGRTQFALVNGRVFIPEWVAEINKSHKKMLRCVLATVVAGEKQTVFPVFNEKATGELFQKLRKGEYSSVMLTPAEYPVELLSRDYLPLPTVRVLELFEDDGVALAAIPIDYEGQEMRFLFAVIPGQTEFAAWECYSESEWGRFREGVLVRPAESAKKLISRYVRDKS